MIGIVILNYNTWTDTVDCIQSLKTQLSDSLYTVYVVDNKSPEKPNDEVLNYLKSQNNVVVIFNKENKGYSAGNNVGIDAALKDGCNYVVISNGDVIYTDDTLLKMMLFLKEHREVGVVGPQIYDKNGNFCKFHLLCRLTAMGKIKNMILHTPLSWLVQGFKKRFIREIELTEPLKVFGVSGCCFMMSRECAEYLYPLDERTFLYEEEYIIGARLENSHFRTYILPQTHIIHAEAASTGSGNSFTYDCLLNSEQLYLREYIHSPFVGWFTLLIIRKFIWLLYKIRGK